MDVAESSAEAKAAEFITKHKPAKLDAQKKWDEAFAEAKRTNRKIWARLGGRYCGPCFLLARWFDEHRKIPERDYVMLKLDEYADENGVSVAKRLTQGGHFGIPFFAIFDRNEKRRIGFQPVFALTGWKPLYSPQIFRPPCELASQEPKFWS